MTIEELQQLVAELMERVKELEARPVPTVYRY
jgi:hypothetical protein